MLLGLLEDQLKYQEERSYPIELAAPGEKGRGRRAKIGSVENKKIKYLDEHGMIQMPN